MGSDDYAVIGGGALKLKGAKIHKKKKKRAKPDLEKNLSGTDNSALVKKGRSIGDDDDQKAKTPDEEKREIEDEQSAVQKTEAERRHEETKKKRLLQMAQGAGSRPGLLKTHKERVEELNTYLSKMSEHHDMPKIGPG